MELSISVVSGRQKQIRFFTGTLQLKDISRFGVLPEDYFGERILGADAELQRDINWARVRKELVPYLVNNADSFYSSLTLFIVPEHGDLRPVEEGRGKHYHFVPDAEDRSQSRGRLVVQDCVFFPGDGQHRLASIKEAVKADWDLGLVAVPVVIIPFESAEQSRQLFADLNLNAKPVNKTIGLAFDTRDPLAVVSKQVAAMVPLFRGRVNHKTNSLSKTSKDVITLNALFNANISLLEALRGGRRLDERELQLIAENEEAEAAQLKEIWAAILECFPEWEDVRTRRATPAELRENFVFAFSIGWQAIALAAATIVQDHLNDPDDVWRGLLQHALWQVRASYRNPADSTTDGWSRENPQWQGVAMMGNRVNNTGPGIRATAGYILAKGGVQASAAQPLIESYQASRAQALT